MKFVVLSCSCLIAFASQAQVESRIYYGVKAGLNLSDVVINNVIDPDAESDFNIKTGLHAGVFVTAPLVSDFGLGAELLYSNKGVQAINRINLHYVTVAAFVRYDLSEKFTAEAGPELGYLAAAKSRHGNVNDVWNNKIDLGLNLGLQYKVTDELIFGTSFNAGFSSVIRNTSNVSGEKIRYQNRVLQISLHYVLGNLK
jgi:hypothetical protein